MDKYDFGGLDDLFRRLNDELERHFCIPEAELNRLNTTPLHAYNCPCMPVPEKGAGPPTGEHDLAIGFLVHDTFRAKT